MLCDAIHEVDIHFGRDKFLALLGKHNLLVERKRKYCKTTHSWHHFHRYENYIKDLNIIRYNQVWAADITYLRTEKGFVYLSLIMTSWAYVWSNPVTNKPIKIVLNSLIFLSL